MATIPFFISLFDPKQKKTTETLNFRWPDSRESLRRFARIYLHTYMVPMCSLGEEASMCVAEQGCIPFGHGIPRVDLWAQWEKPRKGGSRAEQRIFADVCRFLFS